MEKNDDPEEQEDDESENHYDGVDLEVDDYDRGDMVKSSCFEERWSVKVRFLPEALNSTDIYDDPNEKERRRNTKETLPKTMRSHPKLNNSTPISSSSSPKNFRKAPYLFSGAHNSKYDESSTDEEDAQRGDDGKGRFSLESLDSSCTSYDPHEAKSQRNIKETLSRTMICCPKLSSSQSPSSLFPQKTIKNYASSLTKAHYSKYEENSFEEIELAQTGDDVSYGKTKLVIIILSTTFDEL